MILNFNDKSYAVITHGINLKPYYIDHIEKPVLLVWKKNFFVVVAPFIPI